MSRDPDPPGRPGRPGFDPWEMVKRRSIVDRMGERLERRRAKIRREIERSRDSRVPTWALVLLLVAFVTGWVLLVVLV